MFSLESLTNLEQGGKIPVYLHGLSDYVVSGMPDKLGTLVNIVWLDVSSAYC